MMAQLQVAPRQAHYHLAPFDRPGHVAVPREWCDFILLHLTSPCPTHLVMQRISDREVGVMVAQSILVPWLKLIDLVTLHRGTNNNRQKNCFKSAIVW